jgi:hypothetical protein
MWLMTSTGGGFFKRFRKMRGIPSQPEKYLPVRMALLQGVASDCYVVQICSLLISLARFLHVKAVMVSLPKTFHALYRNPSFIHQIVRVSVLTEVFPCLPRVFRTY